MRAEAASFLFDGVEVRPGRFEVLRAGKALPLEPKSIRVLLHLINHRERAVSKDELIQAVWDGSAVTDNALTRVIAQLRRELGDDARQPRYIQTIPTLGYRFVAPLESAAPPRRRRQGMVAAGLVVCFVGLAGWLVLGRTVEHAVRTGPHVQVTSSPGLDLMGTWSPDGLSMVYSSDRGGPLEIYTRGNDGREVQVTDDGGQNVEPAWSPDGRWIAFHSGARGGIWVAPAGGGTARRLTAAGSQPAWSPDGKRIAYRSEDVFSAAANDLIVGMNPASVMVVDAAGGKPVEVVPADLRQGFPSWSPDGSRILYSVFDGRSGHLWTVRPDGSERRKLFSLERNAFINPVYSPAGDAIYYGAVKQSRNFGLFLLRLRGGAVIGEPVELALTGTAIPRNLAVSRDRKRLAYTATSTSSTLWSLTLDGSEPKPLYNHVVFRSSFPVFSPDGKRIAFFARLFGGMGDIWMMNADGSGAAPVTSAKSQDLLPSWTPDGSSIVYSKHTEEQVQLWQISLADRSERALLNGAPMLGWPRMSRDGKAVVYHSKAGPPMNVWTSDLASGAARQLTFDKEGAGFPVFSPDGQSIAYELIRGRDTHLAVMDRDGGRQTQLTSERGHTWVFGWSPDGSKLLFAGFRGGVWDLYWLDRTSREQRKLTRFATMASYVRYPSWSPVEDRVVYEYAVTRGNVYTLELE